MISHLFDRTESKATVTAVPFGIFDEKGRELGVVVSRVLACGSEVKGGDMAGYYGVVVHSAKDGKKWGASQAWAFFKTNDEQLAYIERRISDTKKRYLKKYAQ